MATGGNHLNRGVFGAPALATGVDHPSGSRWCFLPPGLSGTLQLPLLPAWIGTTIYFKIIPPQYLRRPVRDAGPCNGLSVHGSRNLGFRDATLPGERRMSEIINLNNTTPAAPSGARNNLWQKDGTSVGVDPVSGYPIYDVSDYMTDMVGDTGSGGEDGLVPAPPSGSAAAGKYLKADATWEVPPGTVTPASRDSRRKALSTLRIQGQRTPMR